MRRLTIAVVVLIAVIVVGASPAQAAATIHVPCHADEIVRADALQQALDNVRAGGTVTLTRGCVYTGYGFQNLSTGFYFAGNKGGRVRLTTQGCVPSSVPGHGGRVTPASAWKMATIRAGNGNVPYGLSILNGPGGGNIEIVCVRFAHNLPNGHGEMLRIGSTTETDPNRLAADITVRQVIFQGSEKVGQKRAIAAMGRRITIEQSWCEDIFIAGQDSQCIASWNGGKTVTVQFNYLQAGSEHILLGGSPMADVDMSPTYWLISDNILHKPLRWKTDGRHRQVKNLLELKFGKRITAQRNLLVNNWIASQAGAGILVNYNTNGRCPYCPGLHDISIADNVMLNSAAGLEIQAHAYEIGGQSPERLHNLDIRNNYFALTGPGRTIMLTNVEGEHNVAFVNNTFLNASMNWFNGDIGYSWKGTGGAAVRLPGGPMQGLSFRRNVFTSSGKYGATAPEGMHFASGLGEFANQGLIVAANVFGTAGGGGVANLANVNQYDAGRGVNVLTDTASLLKRLPSTACGSVAVGVGADCSRLQSVFAARKYLPEP